MPGLTQFLVEPQTVLPGSPHRLSRGRCCHRKHAHKHVHAHAHAHAHAHTRARARAHTHTSYRVQARVMKQMMVLRHEALDAAPKQGLCKGEVEEWETKDARYIVHVLMSTLAERECTAFCAHAEHAENRWTWPGESLPLAHLPTTSPSAREPRSFCLVSALFLLLRACREIRLPWSPLSACHRLRGRTLPTLPHH